MFHAGESLQPPMIGLRSPECRALLAFLSPEFRRSERTDQEVGQCLGRGKPVLSVQLVRTISPHGFLSRSQALKVDGMTPAISARGVVGAIARLPVERSYLSASLINVIGRIWVPKKVECIGRTIAPAGVHGSNRRAASLKHCE
jgi:hypothetical protein